MKVVKVAYDPNQNRKPGVQDKLDAIAHRRRGYGVRATVLGRTGRYMPIPVRDCIHCGEPAPMIEQDARFFCRSCVIIFAHPIRKKT